MIVFLSILFQICCGVVHIKAECTLSVNKHLSDPQPLLLLQNEAVDYMDAFPLPVDDEGTLKFRKGETIDVACPGSSVLINGLDTKAVLLEAKCISSSKFELNKKTVSFTSITCLKNTDHEARYTNKKCGKKFKEIEIGFSVENRFIKHITTCFDNHSQNALYAKSVISAKIAGNQRNYPRPGFQIGGFYNVKPANVNELYSQNGQRETINKILGHEESDTSIIQPKSNFYLATGHYTPKADFVYGAQQRLTFYYVNAAPQWQTCNGGNWKVMEDNYRDLAHERKINLTVYTGSHGISTLPDIYGVESELLLWKKDDGNGGIPVPAFFYKILYEPNSQAGIALIGLNNPYKIISGSDIICKDLCDKVGWLTWKNKNVTLGYGYCCTIAEFRKTVTVLPKFTVRKLLV